MTSTKALAEHFFRSEYAKIVSVITRYFGLQKMNQAEDIVQDTLMEAINTWEFKGIPENPQAWLYTVAKNKAINALKKNGYDTNYRNSLDNTSQEIDIEFSEGQIADDQLKMMFVCCHSSISQEAQICLTLKTLCGLSTDEIARAFLSSSETINKRLVRARRALRENNISFDFPDTKALKERFETVLKTIFLLFNEGYSVSKGEKLINYELCLESIRLAELLHDHKDFQHHPSLNGLLALMLLNASRFDARVDKTGQMILLPDQDRSLWNEQLINRGLIHLKELSSQNVISTYHILATISAYHCIAKDYESTDWNGILNMYDTLIKIDSSPLVKFNRAIAISKVDGAKPAIKELLKLESQIPTPYYLFQSTLADMYIKVNNHKAALMRLEKALPQTNTELERKTIANRITLCKKS